MGARVYETRRSISDRLFAIPILATLCVPADTNRAATVREPEANRLRKANRGRIF